MWRRADVFHPATAIAGVALFVSLGGVTYAAATIGTKDIKNGAVSQAKIKRSAVTLSKLANGAVRTEKLATGAVTSAKIRAGAVTLGKIADAGVPAEALATGAVTEAKVGSGAVTESKIATGAVTSAKLAAGAAVSGRGRAITFVRALADTVATTGAVTVADLVKVDWSCAAGALTTRIESVATADILVRRVVVTDAVSPVVATQTLGAGLVQSVVAVAPSQETLWTIARRDGSDSTVLTLRVSHFTAAPDCTVVAQGMATP